jgi:hypothetical protein
VIEQALDRVRERLRPVTLDEVEQSPRADVTGGDLRVHVADDEIETARCR